jgi:hypothetical protein
MMLENLLNNDYESMFKGFMNSHDPSMVYRLITSSFHLGRLIEELSPFIFSIKQLSEETFKSRQFVRSFQAKSIYYLVDSMYDNFLLA